MERSNTQAMAVWRCGTYSLNLEPGRPYVMGILNVTPDSFSDGGEHADAESATAWGGLLADQGADIIDVGGESTRPGADDVGVEEEARRVVPVITELAGRFPSTPLSVDTRHAPVAGAALLAGASIINDVSGFRDPEMTALAADSDAGLVVMHMRGEPRTMQEAPVYSDVLAEVRDWLAARCDALEAEGVRRDRIVVDPGIGFGKTAEHNLELLRRLPELAELGYPVLVGASRKRFIGLITDDKPAGRVEGSIAAALWAADHGASVVRVHDVAPTRAALAVGHAIHTGKVPGGAGA